MKNKVLFFDLAICSVWMLSIFGGRVSWSYPPFFVAALAVMFRIVASYSLYHYKEVRSWLPLGMVLLLTGMFMSSGIRYYRGGDILNCILEHNALEYGSILEYILYYSLFGWLLMFPCAYYLFLLIRKQLNRTELTWKDLLGGVLWHGRLEKASSAIMMVMLVSLLAGLSMNAQLCMLVCLTSPPLTCWLVCRYYKVKAERLWVLVVSMTIFWYAQLSTGVLRASLLLLSFILVVYVVTKLYKNIGSYLWTNVLGIYLGILLPSFAIGYNQYACINYARKGNYLSPFQGILIVTDSSYEHFGLRDRYGLLVKPEYEWIQDGDRQWDVWRYICTLKKDGYERFYDVLNNEFVNESNIRPDLQHEVVNVIENHFKWHGSGFADKGHITITELIDGKTIANVRVSMHGNPFLIYADERFMPDDSITISAGEFCRNDSVNLEYCTKHSLSYAVNVPSDSVARYRIYVRLATDSIPSEDTMRELAKRVATLPELKQK